MSSNHKDARRTIFEITWVGIESPGDSGELDLLKLLALDPSPLRQSFFGLAEHLTLTDVSRKSRTEGEAYLPI